MNSTAFICPVCYLGLEPDGGSLKCSSGHSYDVAREGYVNLITGKQPGSSEGDSAEMVAARREFLGIGFYQPLVDELAVIAAASRPRVIADIGCGEGYYLRELLGRPEFAGTTGYGTDLSKAAVAAAAKADSRAQCAVADTNRLIPLADDSVDVMLNIFAPRNQTEFARVVRSGGRLLVATAGPEHLASLREKFGLIGIEADKVEKITAGLEGFTLQEVRRVEVPMRLNGAQLHDLLEMTPNARHLDAAKRAEIDATTEAFTQAQFEVLAFKRS